MKENSSFNPKVRKTRHGLQFQISVKVELLDFGGSLRRELDKKKFCAQHQHVDLCALLSKPQPNLYTTVGFVMKMTLQTPPTTETQCHQYLSCY